MDAIRNDPEWKEETISRSPSSMRTVSIAAHCRERASLYAENYPTRDAADKIWMTTSSAIRRAGRQ